MAAIGAGAMTANEDFEIETWLLLYFFHGIESAGIKHTHLTHIFNHMTPKQNNISMRGLGRIANH